MDSLLDQVFKYLDPHITELLAADILNRSLRSAEQLLPLRFKALGKTSLHSQKLALLSQIAQSEKDQAQVEEVRRSIEAQIEETKQQRARLEETPAIKQLKQIIGSEVYSSLSASRFSRNAVDGVEELKQIIMSRQMLNDGLGYAKLMFSTGEYEEAYKLVNLLYAMVDEPVDLLNMSWAKLHASIILAIRGNEDAKNQITEEIRQVKSRIESKSSASLIQRISMSCSLLYTALIGLVYVKHKEIKYDMLFELFLEEKFLASIQFSSPQIIRYLVLLYMISYEKKSIRIDHKTLVDILKSEICTQEDDFSAFIRLLYMDFDLENAKKKIEQVKLSASRDIIYSSHAAQITESCQKMYFEVYCKIFNTLEIKTVADFLQTSLEEAEIWIINLIRKNNIKAAMDVAGTTLLIGSQASEESESLARSAKELMSRNRILLNNVSKITSA